jgi:crotonobetainyl-CoA:carnitine CoA-transferase CaiB-like acyl-CoA transferase
MTDPKAFANVRVLDFTHVLAGPYATAQLAMQGADVIKVEPRGGEPMRVTPTSREWSDRKLGPAWMAVNANKRSLTLDLSKPQGVEIVHRIAREVDVVVENFRPGTLDKLGLGWDALHARRPELIYCSITGSGLQGPLADSGGFDLVAQAFAGLMSITGEPGRAPVKVGSSVADLNAGLLATSGILAAYVHRLKTGEGQRVDTSLMEAALHQTGWHASVWFATGTSPGPLGSGHVLTAPYQAFHARDRWIVIGGANQANWTRICEVLGHPEWKVDPRFVDNAARMANLDALVAAIDAVLGTRDAADWLAAFEAAGVPAGPVHSIGDALSHPQTRARGMVVELDHPQAGRTAAIGPPLKFSATPASVTRAAPLLGEHTREVLREHGWGDAAIDALIDGGAAKQAGEGDR